MKMLLLLVVVAACGGKSDAPAFDLSGADPWRYEMIDNLGGSVFPGTLTNVTQDKDGDLRCDFTLRMEGSSVILKGRATGAIDGRSVRWRFSVKGYQPWGCAALATKDRQIGECNGSGLVGSPFAAGRGDTKWMDDWKANQPTSSARGATDPGGDDAGGLDLPPVTSAFK